MNFIKGEILSFNKPYGWTSFQVVSKVRSAISKKLHVKKMKVGHAGTLDPLATGVLIVCTGKSTKLIDELQSHTKEYIATLKLGLQLLRMIRKLKKMPFIRQSTSPKNLLRQCFRGSLEL